MLLSDRVMVPDLVNLFRLPFLNPGLSVSLFLTSASQPARSQTSQKLLPFHMSNTSQVASAVSPRERCSFDKVHVLL